MPRFDLRLAGVAQIATAIAKAGEAAHISAESTVRRQWTVARLEALYELAYLRVFAAWESCLEAIFLRSLCGYASRGGQETLKTGGYFPSLAAAEAAAMGPGRTYLLWHNPVRVINRCQQFIRAGREEITINSNLARLQDFADARHRVVHDHTDAKRKFDVAALNLVGRTYPASRPGRLLRDWDRSAPVTRRWLETVALELTNLAGQMT
jgi:hypothetical protein